MTQSRVLTPHRSPKMRRQSRKNDDSPSRQLLLDLERAMGRIQVHETELQRVRAFNRRSYYDGLEAWDQERAQSDLAALDAATAKHDAVRHEAEAELEKYYRELEEEQRRQREENERLEAEKQAREKAERERKEREEADRQAKIRREKEAAAKKAAEEKAKAEAAEAKRKEREDTAARERAEEERAAKELAEKELAETRANAEKEAQVKAQAAAASQAQEQSRARAVAEPGSAEISPELAGEHKRYLDIHKSLKKFRKEFWTHAKSDPTLKPVTGDMRRAIRQAVGQLTDSKERGANKIPTEKVRTILSTAMSKVPSPPVNLTDYIYVDSAHSPPTHTDAHIPSLLLYLLTNFAKAVVASFAAECSTNPRAAEPIGTLVASIFGSAELQVPISPNQTTSLISVLICKLHANIPVLFGTVGLETTGSGRNALGWRREYIHDGDSSKNFIPDIKHYERMTGLAAGYASIALRNFSKTKLRNPYPPKHYWQSLANIVNISPDKVQTTHLIVLKNMLEIGVDRFILFYGSVGVAALREALVAFPARLPAKLKEGSAARGLELLGDTFKKEKNFTL